MTSDLHGSNPAAPIVPVGKARDLLTLSAGEWLAAATGVIALVVLVPSLWIWNHGTRIEPDYRIPYSLSHRYGLYQRYTDLASQQYPAITVGDSVVWGQCAVRTDTLAHHLNLRGRREFFANGGLDAMHPIALETLLEYHAPALTGKEILIQFNPLWTLSTGDAPTHRADPLQNRPNLLPRLGTNLTSSRILAVERAWETLRRTPALAPLVDRVTAFQVDYLRWSLSHPYENPLSVITSVLPSSDDSFCPLLEPWNRPRRSARIDCIWPEPERDEMWAAFGRTLALLRAKENRVFVLVGPINEHMLTESAVRSYRNYTGAVGRCLRSLGIDFSVPAVLASEHYADVCHPLGGGYAELAKKLWEDEVFVNFHRRQQH